jgi:TonB family protein
MQIIKYFLIVIFLPWFTTISAQPSTPSATSLSIDTTIIFMDYFGRIQELKNATFQRKVWKENGKYRMIINDLTTGSPNRNGWFADSALKEKSGVFEDFHTNGRIKDSGRYEGKLKMGTFKTWHENGHVNSIRHFKNDLPVDTGKAFDPEGRLILLSVTNHEGNGMETSYYPGGSIKQTGSLMSGKKEGTWTIHREDGTKMMQVEFIKDSVTLTHCFGMDGKSPAEGNCVYEKSANFPGGLAGWRNFLTTKLVYPRIAIQKEIQGTVMVGFIVEKDGSLADLKILSSPHESLSKEALRLMTQSPTWEPAIQLNKEVKSLYRQPIQFRLE